MFYELVVEARKKPAYLDQATQSDQKKITVEVLPVNEPPVFIELPARVEHPEHSFDVLTRDQYSKPRVQFIGDGGHLI